MYYRKRRYYKKKSSSAESPIEMLFEILFILFQKISELLVRLIFWLLKELFALCKKYFWQNNFKQEIGILEIKEVLPGDSLTTLNNRAIEKQLSQNDQVNIPLIDGKYLLKDSLLTASEIDFLNVLKQVVGDSYSIHEQISLSALVKVKDSNDKFTNYSDFNKIKAKSIDFVLYEKDSLKPFLCIELDDLSHLRWDRQKRDAFVDEVMQGVGLRIIHVRVSRFYNIEWLRSQIFIK